MKVFSILIILVFYSVTNTFSQVLFTSHTITTDAHGANSVYAVDVDSDGDMDIISAFFWDDKIDWYENLSIVGINDIKIKIPNLCSLDQNYPNPFNPTTKINYQIPKTNFVTLKVYDVLGNEVATLVNEEKPIGNYEVEFNATDYSSGIYFYKLQAGSFVETKKMVLLR